MVRTDPYRWQAPGNGRLFDSSLENWHSSKMSERCIGVLQYLEENPLIEKTDFERDISAYLEKKFGHEQNQSIRAHFYRPLEFIGFMRNMDDLLSLSIDGKNFLNSMLDEDYDSALESYVLQLMKTSYPNHATEDIKLSLFPFRIMFKLLSKNSPHKGVVPKKMFYTEIPYITSINDINPLLNKLSDSNYLYYLKQYSKDQLKEISKNYYEKWNAWVVSSLKKMNIVDEFGTRGNTEISLASPIDEFIEGIIDKMPYENMFFISENQFEDVKDTLRCKPRDQSIIYEVIKESSFKCFIDENHETFPSNTRPNYVEGHHVIPISWQDSFEKELDCKENVIALCPNCHKAIHYATNDYKKELLKIIADKNEGIANFNVSLEDLKEMYLNKKVPAK